MDAVTEKDFLRWAAGVGIGFDPRYPESRSLRLLSPCDQQARFWVFPHDPTSWPYFAGTVLGGLDEWKSGHLWPHSGRWPDLEQSQSYGDAVRNVLLRGAGIPSGWTGAVQFNRDEEDELVAVLFGYQLFGGCEYDDLFFVPDHGRQLLQTDHHDVIHVSCATKERVQKLVIYMAEAGYELPTELPDLTFIRPEWMVRPKPGSVSDGGVI